MVVTSNFPGNSHWTPNPRYDAIRIRLMVLCLKFMHFNHEFKFTFKKILTDCSCYSQTPDLVELIASFNVNIVKKPVCSNDGMVARVIKLLQLGEHQKLIESGSEESEWF